MPRMTIRSLNTQNNRRIKLIKTATSVVDIGQQQGAVVNQSDYVGICLAPKSGQISCEGAVVSAYFGELIPEAMTQSEYNAINTDPELQYTWEIDDVDVDYNTFSQSINIEGVLDPTVDQLIPLEMIPEGYKDAVDLGWATMTQASNKTLGNHRIKIGYNKDVPLKPMFWGNPTAIDNQACLSPQDTPVFTCTPETESDHVQLSKVRSGFPSATFVNVPFNVYENGIQIGSNLTLNSLNDMGQVGLTCVFENMEQTLMSVYNNWPQGRSVRLQPVENFVADVDVTQGNGMVDEDSLWLCLAPAQV